MNDDVNFIVGCIFISLICAWGVWALASQLRLNVKSKTAVDQTLSEVGKQDAPGLYSVQTIGLILLIGVSTLIGIGAIVVMIQRVLGES